MLLEKKPNFICTIGRNTNNKNIIKEMYENGMNFIRFNMSYRLNYYDDVVKYVRELNNEFGYNIGIICDLAGTEMRVITEKEIDVRVGQKIIIGKDFNLDQGDLSVLAYGDEILIKDGRIVLKVEKYDNGLLYCKSLSDEVITKNANCYNKKLYDNLTFISEKDKMNLDDAIRYNADYIAVSHVRNKRNLDEIRNYLMLHNSHLKLMSKIENLEAVQNLDEVIKYSDAIMIARGDLGKILPFFKIAYYQKIITKKTLLSKKMLVSATDYLFSLVNFTIPTRAEVVDLFTAFLDGIDSIMFTKEVAHSENPVYLLQVANEIYKSYLEYKNEVEK